MDHGAVELELTTDAARFLEQAAPLLAADPVASTVVATVTRRLVGAPAAPAGGVPRWWCVARRGTEVVGAAMRTMDVAPFAAYVLAMPEPAARALARAVHERGEHLTTLIGARPAVDLVADELARLGDRAARVAERQRLHVLGTLHPPPAVAGGLRLLRADEAPLARAWFDAFVRDAAAQAGRAVGDTEPHRLADVTSRIEAGLLWCWADPCSTPVSLAGVSAPAGGLARVGPVYTPPEHRRRGYAGAAVHGVSAVLRADGHQVCLVTDLANPTSNHVYAALGFEPRDEVAVVVLDATAAAHPVPS